MDLNLLLHAHQIEAMQASAACDDVDRQRHLDAAASYAELIRKLRNEMRNANPSPSSRPSDQVINGTYTGGFSSTADILT